MTPHQSISTCLRKYVTFSGRATRSEFWWFALAFCTLLLTLFALAIQLEALSLANNALDGLAIFLMFAGPIPLLAAASRRIHDIGQENVPVWILVAVHFTSVTVYLSAFVGAGEKAIGRVIFSMICEGVFFVAMSALALFFLSRASEPGSNRHGPNPNEVIP